MYRNKRFYFYMDIPLLFCEALIFIDFMDQLKHEYTC